MTIAAKLAEAHCKHDGAITITMQSDGAAVTTCNLCGEVSQAYAAQAAKVGEAWSIAMNAYDNAAQANGLPSECWAAALSAAFPALTQELERVKEGRRLFADYADELERHWRAVEVERDHHAQERHAAEVEITVLQERVEQLRADLAAARADADFAWRMFARAKCGCLSLDCHTHGGYDHRDLEKT